MRLALPLLLAAPLAAETGFLDREVKVDGETHLYQVYVPRQFSADRAWPVIMFLHGGQESGSNGITQTLIGLPTAIRRTPERFPAIVVIPQSSTERRWFDPAEQKQALAALDKSIAEFHGDPDRVYLTGLSKGGYGTWHLAFREPGRFAAIAPICGGITPPNMMGLQESDFPSVAEVAKKLGPSLPVWVFHGDADIRVPVEKSRELVGALKAIGSAVKYTEYPGVPHNSWDKAYADPEFATWLFAQKRKPRPAN